MVSIPARQVDTRCLLSDALEDSDMTEWVKRDYSKAKIDRSGVELLPWWTDPNARLTGEQWSAYKVVENWRNCHGLPLNVAQAVLRSRAQRVEEKVIVAQRMKRFSSIMNKLLREPHMKLSQMQDLGGCRAILSDVKAVYGLLEKYRDQAFDVYLRGQALFENVSFKCDDYIREPKDDGYRGIHVVARYHPRTQNRQPWDGQRIEIQLRSRLQHAFATTVETVTTFTRAPLKFGAGPTEWRRFFSLTGSALALREGTPLVNGTPKHKKELISELRNATKELKVREKLRKWADMIQTMPRENIEGFEWLLLALDIEKNTIRVTGFTDRNEAAKAIEKIEPSTRKDIDAVLVSVTSIKQLRAAYPNYYADTGKFLEALSAVLSKSQ